MKWLPRHLIRFFCILPVLYLTVLYTLSTPDIDLTSYAKAAEERMGEVLGMPGFWIAAGVFLLLALVRGMTLVWNAIYCCAVFLLLTECVLLLGMGGTILPSALWGLIPYPADMTRFTVALYLIPLTWMLGACCTNAFRSISAACIINFLIWLLLSYACHALAQLWENMQTPYQPELLAQFKTMRWCTAIIPALFMFLYTFFLAIFEALIPRRLLGKKEKQEKEAPQPQTPA